MASWERLIRTTVSLIAMSHIEKKKGERNRKITEIIEEAYQNLRIGYPKSDIDNYLGAGRAVKVAAKSSVYRYLECFTESTSSSMYSTGNVGIRTGRVKCYIEIKYNENDMAVEILKKGVFGIEVNRDKTVEANVVNVIDTNTQNGVISDNSVNNNVDNLTFIKNTNYDNTKNLDETGRDVLFYSIGHYCCEDRHPNLIALFIKFSDDIDLQRINFVVCQLESEGVISINEEKVHSINGDIIAFTPKITVKEFENIYKTLSKNANNVKVNYNGNNEFEKENILIEKYLNDEGYDREKYCEANNRDRLFFEFGKDIINLDKKYIASTELIAMANKKTNGDEARSNHIIFQLREAGLIKSEGNGLQHRYVLTMPQYEFNEKYGDGANNVYIIDGASISNSDGFNSHDCKFDRTEEWLERTPYFNSIGKVCCFKGILNREEIMNMCEVSNNTFNSAINDLRRFKVVEEISTNNGFKYKALMSPVEFEKEFGRNNHAEDEIFDETYFINFFNLYEDKSVSEKIDKEDLFKKIGLYCCKDNYPNVAGVLALTGASIYPTYEVLYRLKREGIIRLNNHYVYNTEGGKVPSISSLCTESEFRKKYSIANEYEIELDYNLNNDADIILEEKYHNEEYDRKKYCDENDRDVKFYDVGILFCENGKLDSNKIDEIVENNEARVEHIYFQLKEAGVISMEKEADGKTHMQGVVKKDEFINAFKNHKLIHTIDNLFNRGNDAKDIDETDGMETELYENSSSYSNLNNNIANDNNEYQNNIVNTNSENKGNGFFAGVWKWFTGLHIIFRIFIILILISLFMRIPQFFKSNTWTTKRLDKFGITFDVPGDWNEIWSSTDEVTYAPRNDNHISLIVIMTNLNEMKDPKVYNKVYEKQKQTMDVYDYQISGNNFSYKIRNNNNTVQYFKLNEVKNCMVYFVITSLGTDEYKSKADRVFSSIYVPNTNSKTTQNSTSNQQLSTKANNTTPVQQKVITGWAQEGNNFKYYNANGIPVTNGWVDSNGDIYYMNAIGLMEKNNWIQTNGNFFYVNEEGKMQKNKWIGEYYVGADGAMLKNTTTPDGYYVGADGKYVQQSNQVNSASGNKSVTSNEDVYIKSKSKVTDTYDLDDYTCKISISKPNYGGVESDEIITINEYTADLVNEMMDGIIEWLDELDEIPKSVTLSDVDITSKSSERIRTTFEGKATFRDGTTKTIKYRISFNRDNGDAELEKMY